MISIWEKNSLLDYDVLIVGAGITGLSTAASLKEKKPNLKIAILERGILPSGASTKNAGFACFGSLTEILLDYEKLGEQKLLQLVEKRWLGLQKTIKRLGKKSVGLEEKGGYELIGSQKMHCLEKIEMANHLLQKIFQKDIFFERKNLLEEFGFANFSSLVYNPLEAELDSGKLMNSLNSYCRQLGVHILTGARVQDVFFGSSQWNIKVGEITFQAQSIAICTNGFAQELFTTDIQPARGLVLLAKPQKKIQFQGCFHYEEGFYYFRNYQGMLLFGGGRNLDIATECTTKFGINEKILMHLKEEIKHKILPHQEIKIEMVWSGIMGFGSTKEPQIQELQKNLFSAVGLNGMGVAIAGGLGEELATKILQESL